MGHARRLLVGAGCAMTLAACGGAADGFGSVPNGPAVAGDRATDADGGSSTAVGTDALVRPVGTPVPAPSVPAPSLPAPANGSATTLVLSFEDQLRADLAEIDANLVACLAEPAACDASTVAVPGSSAHRWLADDARQYDADGILVRQGNGLHTVLESAVEHVPGRTATLVVCATNGLWLVDPTSSGGNGDIIIDDATNSRRQEWTVEMTSDGWRRIDLTTIATFYGTDRCPAQ